MASAGRWPRRSQVVAAARPKAVAVDVILSEKRPDREVNRALAQALCATPDLVLSADLIDDARQWEDPQPEFLPCAKAVGHVHALPDRSDSRTRAIPLFKRVVPPGHDQRRAISLEVFALSRGEHIVTFPFSNDVQVGSTTIPVPGGRFTNLKAGEVTELRPMRVRFLPAGMSLPRISLKALLDDPRLAKEFTGKVVFVGSTATTSGDRLLTPVSPDVPITGIEIHAEAFETMAQGLFLTDVSNFWVLRCSAWPWRRPSGWRSAICRAGGPMPAAVPILIAAQVAPYVFFTHRLRLLVRHAGLGGLARTFMAAAAYYHLVVRRNWRMEQSARDALPAGHALRDPRNAHAAFGHSGFERADLALRADRGEAQADRAS